MGNIDIDRLIEACADDGFDAGLMIQTRLEPLAGDGAPVKPATYAGGVFQLGRRWWGSGGDDRRTVDTISIDNVPSQANRLEAALESLQAELSLPGFVLDLTGLEPLPAHVPRTLSSFVFPHRNADAYLRDAVLDGVDFLDTEVGQKVFGATGDNADALMQWFPQALLFGFWQSHLGKKGRSQAKLARSWVSEIIGTEPSTDADGLILVEGLKGDPLNLTKAGNRVNADEDDLQDWSGAVDGAKVTKPRKLVDLAEIGHGQVPVGAENRALAGVSFREIYQQSTVSFASLRKVRTSEGAPEARALLVALGLVAHVHAFGRAFHLRSGCDLRPTLATWTWLGAAGDEQVEALDRGASTQLFQAAVSRAEGAGVSVGGKWADLLVLHPKNSLTEVIRNTFPLAGTS